MKARWVLLLAGMGFVLTGCPKEEKTTEPKAEPASSAAPAKAGEEKKAEDDEGGW